MTIEVMLRRRANLEEDVPILNARFVQAFQDVHEFWSEPTIDVRDAFDPGSGETAALNLNKLLLPGLSGQIHYAPRLAGYLNRDIAQSDDFLIVRLDLTKIDYRSFCVRTLPSLIEMFRPYRAASQTDPDVSLDDWDSVCEERRTAARDIDGRDSVHRIWPVSYFDDLLCQRSFSMSAEDVLRRAGPECEEARLIGGGVFLLVTSEPVGGPHLDDLNRRIVSRLNG